MMFEGRFDERNEIVPSIVGCAVIPMAIERDNFMFTCEHNTFWEQTIGCGLEKFFMETINYLGRSCKIIPEYCNS